MKKNRVSGILTHTKINGQTTYSVRYLLPNPAQSPKWLQKQKSFIKLDEAIAFKAKITSQVKSGDYQPEVDLTVEQLCEHYLKSKTLQVRPQSLWQYEGYIHNYFIPKFGNEK